MDPTLSSPLVHPEAVAAEEGTGRSYYQLSTTSTNATATIEITNALQFAASKSIRTSTVILASFNALAAFATAVGIIVGCRTYKKRMQRRASDPPSGLFFIHTVEVFPLVLSLGITIQSITFAAAQSVGLQGLLSRGCTITAVFLLPALFIVPFTHFVFGVEAAWRGVRLQFAPRGRWNVTKCLGIVTVSCLVALIVAAVDQTPDFCFASLFWFLRKYAKGCFVVFLGITVVQLIVIGTIFLKLTKSHMVDPTERMAASRMVYYLSLGFISNAFVIPFFFSLTFLDQKKVIFDTLNLSMAAAVVSNVNGLMVTGLHLFLRTQSRSSIGHNLGDYKRTKSVYDRRDPGDDQSGSNHSLQPVSRHNRAEERSESVATLLRPVDPEDGRSLVSPQTARSPFSPKLFIPSGPKYPDPTQPPSETSPSQIRKQQYSIVPQDSSAAAAVLPATTYSPMATKPVRDAWKPPPIVRPWMGRGHKRDSSIVSTATVQIGIRLSNVEDFLGRKSTDSEVADLSNAPPLPDVPPLRLGRPSPLAKVETRPDSAYASDNAAERDTLSMDPPKRRSIRDARMKTLPPTPKTLAVDADDRATEESDTISVEIKVDDDSDSEQDELITLSPTVYTPQEEAPRRSPSGRSIRKLPSPMGVGFNTPASRGGPSSDGRPNHAPPRPTGSAATTPRPNQKADWI